MQAMENLESCIEQDSDMSRHGYCTLFDHASAAEFFQEAWEHFEYRWKSERVKQCLHLHHPHGTRDKEKRVIVIAD